MPRRGVRQLPVIRGIADDPWWDRAAFFTGCCCGFEMLVVGHSLGTTDKGTGSLSRLNPETGAPLWTVDLGTETSGPNTYPRIAYSVDLDSHGNVYVLWVPSVDEAGVSSFGVSTRKQGIKKFDRNGNLLNSVSLPNVHGTWSGTSDFNPPRIRVDRNDDDRIYCCCIQTASNQVAFRVDAGLNVVWSYAPSTMSTALRTTGVAIGIDGNPFYAGDPFPVSKLNASDGSLLLSDTTNGSIRSVAVEPGTGRVRAGRFNATFAFSDIGYSSFPTVAYGHVHTDYPTPTPLGTWDAGNIPWVGSCVSNGLYTLYASRNQLRFDRGGGLGDANASYLIAAPDGTTIGSGWWGEGAVPGGFINEVCQEEVTGNVFVTGGASKTGVGSIITAKLDPLNNGTWWYGRVYTGSGTFSQQGHGIAARTIRG